MPYRRSLKIFDRSFFNAIVRAICLVVEPGWNICWGQTFSENNKSSYNLCYMGIRNYNQCPTYCFSSSISSFEDSILSNSMKYEHCWNGCVVTCPNLVKGFSASSCVEYSSKAAFPSFQIHFYSNLLLDSFLEAFEQYVVRSVQLQWVEISATSAEPSRPSWVGATQLL